MNEQEIIETLTKINRWWTGGSVPPRIKKADFKRRDFHSIKDIMDEEEIISIIGPRQVGKTTVMGQLIEDQLENGVDPKNIMYIPLDNTRLKNSSEDILKDCLEIFEEYQLNSEFGNLDDKCYIYIDEIQSLDNWSEKLKDYYDTYDKIKFITSGSSSLKIEKGNSESLVGRVLRRTMLPLKFVEMVKYHGLKEGINDDCRELRRSFQKAVAENSPQEFFQEIKEFNADLVNSKQEVRNLMQEYFVKGGYPGVLDSEYEKAYEKLNNDLELTVYRDIRNIFNIQTPEDMERLLTVVADSTGQKIKPKKISDIVGNDPRTVKRHISHLENVYMMKNSPPFFKNKKKSISKDNKYYILDPGHRNVLLSQMDEQIFEDATERGLTAQTVAMNHAARLQYYLSGHRDGEVNYWQPLSQNTEVDLVMNHSDYTVPIEVKYTDRMSGSDRKGIYKFMENFEDAEFGIMLTKDKIHKKNDIYYIPLWLFCLMC